MTAEDKADMAEAAEMRRKRREELADRIRRHMEQNPEMGVKPTARVFSVCPRTVRDILKEKR